MGFDPTLHSHNNFLLKFVISHIFSHRAPRDFHHLPKGFQDQSFKTVAYINSHLCCRGGAAWPLFLSTRMNSSQKYEKFPCSLRQLKRFGVVPQGGGGHLAPWHCYTIDEDLSPWGTDPKCHLPPLHIISNTSLVVKMKTFFLLGIPLSSCPFSNTQHQGCSRGSSSS